MIIDNSNIFLVSYLGGSFGNALANLINAAVSNNWQKPNQSNYHTMQWPYDSEQAFIRLDSPVDFSDPIDQFTVVQFHCLNSFILRNRFPNSKGILLSYTPDQEKYILNRLWQVLYKPTCSEKLSEQVISAFNHIVYNKTQLKEQQISFESCDRIKILAFDQVIDNIDVVENLINCKISARHIEKYQTYIDQQMINFYTLEPSIKLAWEIYEQFGADAPILDLVKELPNENNC
jgi:hypothetical protein